MSHRCVHLSQTANCEPTPEGGTVCSDGTYHPPGCPTNPPIKAPAKFPTTTVVAGLGGAGVLAGLLFLIFKK